MPTFQKRNKRLIVKESILIRGIQNDRLSEMRNLFRILHLMLICSMKPVGNVIVMIQLFALSSLSIEAIRVVICSNVSNNILS